MGVCADEQISLILQARGVLGYVFRPMFPNRQIRCSLGNRNREGWTSTLLAVQLVLSKNWDGDAPSTQASVLEPDREDLE